MKIIYIEPYLGFSHKHWIEGYQKNSSHEVEIVGLPARHWKWRMHGGAISLAKMMVDRDVPDLFLVSGMIDLPLFKSLLPKSMTSVPIALYFHENQFAYPKSEHQQEKHSEHFNFINLKSAMAADKVFFNSQYNKESLLKGSRNLIRKMPDCCNQSWVDEVEKKSKVLHLGMSFTDEEPSLKSFDPPLLLWNHRHEYDKNPELFFESLFKLKEEKVGFRLAVLGESFKTSPAIFEKAKTVLADEISYWGFQERETYEKIMREAALLPVTSNQDFFGISVIEAVMAGVVPVLPNRLAYPEHFNEPWFFDSDENFYELLKEMILDPKMVSGSTRERLRGYSWETMAALYDEELFKT